MDPRLLGVAQTGFIGDDLIIPRSVINELQLLADGKDHDKRIRARAGLDAIRELERVVYFNLTILDDNIDRTPVDNRLLDLARANRGLILSNDFNLQKVAAADHIDVLNLNQLALALRNEYLPGEKAQVKIISLGSNPNQGVAYLKDGTMVVVDQASRFVGEEVEVEFIRLNQTASGSMMFARIANSPKISSKTAPKSVSKLTSKSVSKIASRITKPIKPSNSPKPSSKSNILKNPKTTKAIKNVKASKPRR